MGGKQINIKKERKKQKKSIEKTHASFFILAIYFISFLQKMNAVLPAILHIAKKRKEKKKTNSREALNKIKWFLSALSMDDGRTGFVVFTFRNPHFFKSGKR